MKTTRASLTILILLIVAAIQSFAQTETRASRTWEVQKYDLNVTLPTTEADRSIAVRATLSIRNVSAGPASSLTLRISPKAEVSGVKVGGSIFDFTKSEEKVGGGSLQRIAIRGVSAAPGGSLTAEVTYKLRVDENSGIAAATPLGAQLLPLAFWYPTPNSWFFPRGADFAPYRVQVSAPDGMTVVAAGNLAAGVFDQPLYGQPSFIAGNYETTSVRNVFVSLAKGTGTDERKRADELAGFAADARAYFENLFGTSANVPLRIVSARRGAGFADSGMILIDENVFRRQKLDSLTAMTIAESVARIWIGGSTAVSGESSGALREGLVRFAATEFLESKFGKEIADLERMRQRTAYAAVSKRDAPITLITPLDEYYFVTNSNKGAMVWRLLSKKIGADAFWGVMKANMRTGSIDLAGIRGAFPQQKDLLDYSLDQVTDIDLMIGLPQSAGGETKMALRNTGSVEAQVDVTAITDKGERLRNNVTVPARGFADTVFRTANQVLRVEVDSDKIYPQLNYANDVKPFEIDETDALLFIKRLFDRQDFPGAERNARLVIRDYPRFDDARVLLARALLAQGKTAEAEREFRTALDEKLPTGRTLAWANVGLGEIALKNNQAGSALAFFDQALRTNGEVGATLAARQGRLRANPPTVTDESIKAYFAAFDKAAIAANKAALETMLLSGETPKAFAGGIAGQAQEWTSKVTQVEVIDAQNVIVEVNLAIRIINKEPESGVAVFRLARTPSGWKLSSVESFEVR